MDKSLYTWFQEKFENQLKCSNTRQDAFDRTIQEIGFNAYSSYTSFAARRTNQKKVKKRFTKP